MPRGIAWVVIAGALAVGCVSAETVVLRKAATNPFVGAKTFALEPLSFQWLKVNGAPVDAWLMMRSDKQRTSFEVDERETARLFAEAVTEGGVGARAGASGAFVIKPFMTDFKVGETPIFDTSEGFGRMTVQFLDPQSKILDEIVVKTPIRVTLANPSFGQQIREAGEVLGKQVVRYLRERTRGR